VRGHWDHEIDAAAPIHPIRLLRALASGGYEAVQELYGVSRGQRTLVTHIELARAGQLEIPRNRPARPMPRRHYRVDWSRYDQKVAA